ncbi:MAG: PEP-CTERM sorting domain-containing protein [Planctomycetaceae bacterium]|nr:PEP-CTERM sorting domain-containing protein [Planctomycetaceae bacterium]
MSVEIVGTPNSDGVYDAKQLDDFELGVPWWFVRDSGDVYAGLPAMTFDFEGQNVWLMGIAAQYPNDGSATTIYPRPYENEDVTFVNELFIPPEFLVGPYAMGLSDISGYARVVPEPSTLALGSIALISLAALRRRK